MCEKNDPEDLAALQNCLEEVSVLRDILQVDGYWQEKFHREVSKNIRLIRFLEMLSEREGLSLEIRLFLDTL